MRMMKGGEDLEMTFVMIILAIGVAMVVLIVFLKLSDTSAAVKTSQNTIDAINEAHRAMFCLAGTTGIADESQITRQKLDGCGISYDVQVIDIDAGRKIIGNIANPDHSVYLSIRSGDSLHFGELDVKKK